jgi:putative PEP-CTERM system histidine kinase
MWLSTPTIAFASALSAATMALTVAWSEKRSAAYWSFVAGMGFLTLEAVFLGLRTSGLLSEDVNWEDWRLLAMSFLPGCWLTFSLTFARGNDREFLWQWRYVLGAAFLMPAATAILFWGRLVGPRPADPSGLELELAGIILYVFFLLAVAAMLMNLERTFRAAAGTMRWRIKFVALGIGVLFVGRGFTACSELLHHATQLSFLRANSQALLAGCLLAAFSVFRSGQLDVRVYPSHGVLHQWMRFALALVYILIVLASAQAFKSFGGESFFEAQVVLVLSALVVLLALLLSDGVRLRTRRFVSRHFQRPQYDYRRAWRAFTEGTAQRVELPALCGALVELISEQFEALSVTLWLTERGGDRFVFGASTSLSPAKAQELSLSPAEAGGICAHFRTDPGPVDIDAEPGSWSAPLQRLHPDKFGVKRGHRLCVPMIARGELIGVIMLGDRVGGTPFSLQDYDLLKCVSDQAAASLLNMDLSQKLARAKQLEAFQSMSAFFVHDLKNTASTLSLMLQNLPVHFNNPGFQEDALQGISRISSHINDLISRLSVLRQEISVRFVPCDLNQVVTETLQTLKPGLGAELEISLAPLPAVNLDPEQIRTVLTNLLLNARDAIRDPGRIRVETSVQNSSVALAISDNGCGMSPEFIQTGLFSPFQTTKKEGIGIGMFQSKMIVEAHHGKIEVESELGKGTTFRVILPVTDRHEP